MDRLPILTRELIDKKPAVLLAWPNSPVQALARLTTSIPIVQSNGGDLVALGLAKSLARPGGNVTGVTNINLEISAKHVELLTLARPQLRRIGFLVDPGAQTAEYLRVANRALAHFKVEGRFAEATRPEDIRPAIARLAQEGIEALVILGSGWFSDAAPRREIVSLALSHRWPVIGNQRNYVEEGALLSYGADRIALYRRSAYFVDRILKGAKPADLPIEQPTTFECVVNMKTVKALGLTMPPEFMVRATHVIQ
jgi:putative ABC transport system substrate-binding protein